MLRKYVPQIAIAGSIGVLGLIVARLATRRTTQMADSKESKMLDYVRQNATKGDPKSVVNAIDAYCRKFNWMMNLGDDKGPILDKALQDAKPKTVFELGTYCGYSSTRMASILPSDVRIVTFEMDPTNAAIAKQIHEFAGVTDRVTIELGKASDKLAEAFKRLNVPAVDFFFIDHWKDAYLPDLKLIESLNIMRKGTVVVADNIIYPGAPDYAEYVRKSPRYTTKFYEANLEYRPDVKDGVEVSVFKG